MARLVARIGLNRYDADQLYHSAIKHYDDRNLDQAVLDMNAAIKLYPNRSEYYAARAFFRLEDGLPVEAETDFDQALQINPYEVLANYGKGVIAFNRKEYAVAQDYFMRAWAADSSRAETMYYLALVYHRQRDNAQAVYWMQQAIARYEALQDDSRENRRRLRNAEKWLSEFEALLAQAASEG